MRARLGVLDLDIWDSSDFFKMLASISGNEEVDLASFVTGCMQLRGAARRLTMQAVHADVIEVKKLLKQSFERQVSPGSPVADPTTSRAARSQLAKNMRKA